MVKCRLISEEDIQEQSEEVDSTLNDLPEEIMIEQDKLIGKINALSKGSKRHKYKHQNKSMIFRSYENYWYTIGMSDTKSVAKVPTTRNALKVNKKLSQEDTSSQNQKTVE